MKTKDLPIKLDTPLTKRILMGIVARLWDPFGYLIPVTIKYRIYLQQLWQMGYGWDEIIPVEHSDKWRDCINQIHSLNKFKIPRCLKPDGVNGLPQLHAFSDGGNSAYGTCVYIRWPTVSGIKLQLNN